MKHSVTLTLLLVLLVGTLGCVTYKQAQDDKTLSDATPLAQGEISPEQKAQTLANMVSGIPYVGLATPLVLFVGVWFYGVQRGRRIRTSLTPLPPPVTAIVTTNPIVQNVADVRTGIMDVADPESGLRRTWKALVLSALTAGIFAAIHTVIGTPSPEGVNPAIWSLVLAALMGAEKFLQRVLPVVP